MSPSIPVLSDLDEYRHADVAVETWWWWGIAHDRSAGLFVGFEVRGDRFDYWAGLVRDGEPYLYIEELDGRDMRAGLEIKPPEMWADHVCDLAFRQWSLGNEAHGVLLDDPTEAWRRAYGTVVPVTFDVEWYASAALDTNLNVIPHGYHQIGEVDVQVELTEGLLAFAGSGERVHLWGVPYVPSSFAMPIVPPGFRAPYRRSDGGRVDQVMSDQWYGATLGSADGFGGERR